ncbi:hypothetical protein NLG97_g2480 [Lecanicillium saksenae]|uniref:Uncharacterized protein n=1 Tax=Lecanicillium saksenae TaxID=468837 RepID=A0ACC1R2M9_9HYPO|nr:hypothetical protein NLG97_g2480 [Lecanicillium saksenae]
MLKFITLATVLLASAASAVPAAVEGQARDSYALYTGNGSPGAGWPAVSAWATFDSLDDSAAEIADIKSAVTSIAGRAGIDPRFVLAIVMQESKGCVRVPTTVSPDGGVINPGLMQTHNGKGTCAGRQPCPASSIIQMIEDGTLGTSSGDGLKQTLETAKRATGDGAARMYYTAARIYNSGSATYAKLQDGRGATNCYASDVANRLTGWALAQSRCY